MDEVRADGFLFGYPVWFLHSKTMGDKGDLITLVDDEPVFVLFTDDDLAARFKSRHRELAGHDVVPIPTPEAFDAFLSALEKKGCPNVVFDCPEPGMVLRVGSPVLAIETLRRRILSDE